MVYVLNPSWRRPVKPKTGVARFAAEYGRWGNGTILPCQVRFFNEAFATNRDGSWKFSSVIENGPRQNSKTEKLTAEIGYMLFVLRASIFVCAHESAAVHKIWENVFGMINSVPELKAELDRFASTSGKEFIRLKGGGEATFRSRKNALAGMGGTFDIVIFDEAQELKADYRAMATKTLRTNENSLTIYLGTPFLPTSTGDIFDSIIKDSEKDPDTYAVRYGIDDENVDIYDKRIWKKTNQLYPDVITDRSFYKDISDANQKGEEGIRNFKIQDLGLWWEDKIPSAIPASLWNAAVLDIPNDPRSNVCSIVFDPLCGRLALSIASFTVEKTIGNKTYKKNEFITGEILGERPQNETWKWIVDIIETMPRETTIIVDAGGLNNAILKILPNNMNIVRLTGAEFLASQQGFYDLVEKGTFKHTNQPELMAQVRNTQKIKSGDLWKFASIHKSKSIAGFKALVEAAWYRSVNEPVEIVPQVILY